MLNSVPTSPNLFIGTSSWNYPSWQGIVYQTSSTTEAGYLRQYSQHYNTAEIDNWFYHIPSPKEVLEYKQAVNPDFRFTCKVPQELCLTHLHSKGMVLEPNPNFFSLDRFNLFLETVEPLRDQIAAFIFEFEYLNKDKMPSLKAFIDKIGEFMTKAPAGLPYAIEPRNLHYIRKEYFKFIQSANLIHVLSEKLYMPHITQVYDEFKSYFGDTVVIRLLGGNRKEIEAKTGNKWDKIVDPKRELASIVQMVGEMVKTRTVVVSVNNHYEGSAPLTIENIKMNLSSYSQGTK